jgi:hypothetical protein
LSYLVKFLMLYSKKNFFQSLSLPHFFKPLFMPFLKELFI